jgi:uncharacterized protein
MLVLDIGLGFFIGLLLGLMGGGGSILTVPALVYLIGQTPQAAVTASLVVVGVNGAVGAFVHRTQGTLNWRVALMFGGAGMAMSYVAAGWSKQVSPQGLMILFALLMLVIGVFMLLRKLPSDDQSRDRGWQVTLGSGGLVGLLTGFLGVGGGFLIVPALVLLVGLPMNQAVGTSLMIIAMNSFAGFLGHLSNLQLDASVIAAFVGAGILGTFAGARISKHVPAERLRVLFAGFVILLALVLLYDNVGKLLS